MSNPVRKSETVSVVILGGFNPAIIHPRWSELMALLRPWGLEDPDQVKVDVVHAEITKLVFATATIEVEPKRFQVRDSESSRLVADFCIALFGNVLVHTPIHAIGINYDVEMELPNSKGRDRIGYTLVPSAPWGEMSAAVESEKGGMLNLSVRLPIAGAKFDRWRDIRVMPHLLDRKRFFVKSNSHFGVAKENSPVPASQVIEEVLGQFEKEIQVGRKIADHIWNIGDSQ